MTNRIPEFEFLSKSRLLRVFASIFLALSPSLIAQEAGLKFEVASIHSNKSSERKYGVSPAGGRFIATNMSLFALVQWAYELEEFRILEGPAWLKADRFDIVAGAAATPTMGQYRLMLQQLLGDRFHLEVHRQAKEVPVYELSVAKAGIRLKEAKCVGTPGPANPCGGTSGAGRGKLIGRAVAMPSLAKDLSGMLGRPVLDKSMLTGEYDFDLTWTPDETSRRGPVDPNDPAPNSDGPSLFTAMQEQLGLTLRSTKGVVNMLIVDRAEPPTEN